LINELTSPFFIFIGYFAILRRLLRKFYFLRRIILKNRWYIVSTHVKKRLSSVFLTLGVISFCALFAFPPASHADPVWGERFELKQPNGNIVEVRIWGDEFYRVVESMDGYTLVRDPDTDIICFARLSDDGNSFVSTGVDVHSASGESLGLQPHLRINADAQRAIVREKRLEAARGERQVLEAAGKDMATMAAMGPPDNGNVKGICLIVDFSDEIATIPAGNINDYCNQIGYSGYGNNGSVRDYFYDVSDGNLTYTNYVTPAYYRAQYPKSYYDDCNAPYGQRTRELIIEALQDLEDNGFDFSQYDSNNDGLIDAINCFYAGVTSCGWANGLWPHSWTVTFNADGKSAFKYQITGIGSSLRLSTFCHENGHMICYWPDLYDYDTGADDSNGVGKYCLMCAYTSSTNPQEPSAYCKSLSGWTTTILLTSPQVGLVVPSDTNTIYKYEHPTLSDEYYLIENRQKAGRDLYLPDHGLAIWHIDEKGSNNNEQMTPALHYEASVEQADGDFDLEFDVNNGDATDLFAAPDYTRCTPLTVPDTDWWDGSSSDLRITEISTSSTLMTFNFNVECPSDPMSLDFGGVPVGCYTDETFTIRNDSITTLAGDVTESCDHYSIISGGGAFSLATGESLIVTVRFEPTVMGTHTCTVGIGGASYCDVFCTGEGLDPSAVCVVQPTSIDFGSVATDDSLDLDFTIYNIGCSTMNGTVSESCSHYEIASGGGSYSIAPGDSQVVSVRFKPTLTGTWFCTIQTGTGCANVSCQGIGILPPPACLIVPDTLNFGNVIYGSFKTMTFDITNTGYGNLIGSMSDACTPFDIISDKNYNLSHNESQTMSIFFYPTSPGSFNCTIETGNSACVDVYCYGTSSIGPVCILQPDTLDFGTVVVGNNADLGFFITNIGGDTLSGTVSEACSHYEIISGAGAYALANGESLFVTVRFEPTVSGNHTCTIETGSAQCGDVYCAGDGTDSALCVVDPDTLDFGTVVVGNNADLDFFITNTGGDTLTGNVSEICDHYSIISGAGAYALAADETLTVTVRFEPTVSGNHTCTIETGSGLCGDVYCTGDGMDPALCIIDPDTLDYGVVTVGDSLDLAFIISNGGGDVLTGDVSEACGHFNIVSGSGGYALAPAETLTVTVRYKPSSIGFHECTIETGSVLCSDVYCSGTGESPPVCVVEPDSLDCGTVSVGDSLDMYFDIINAGGGILAGTVSDTCGYYDVVAGGGSYGLAAGETLHVTVRFKPASDGIHECWVGTGVSCGDVYCTGDGDDVSGLGIVNGKRFYLYQNYPNPFNPITNITFTVPGRAHTTLSIYNIEGRLVKRLVDTEFEGGVKTITWNGTDSQGNPVSSGVYFYRLRAGGNVMTRKMILLK
jgi:M6 family metalloprotease-like protein